MTHWAGHFLTCEVLLIFAHLLHYFVRQVTFVPFYGMGKYGFHGPTHWAVGRSFVTHCHTDPHWLGCGFHCNYFCSNSHRKSALWALCIVVLTTNPIKAGSIIPILQMEVKDEWVTCTSDPGAQQYEAICFIRYGVMWLSFAAIFHSREPYDGMFLGFPCMPVSNIN